jgi:hypothetical protein
MVKLNRIDRSIIRERQNHASPGQAMDSMFW